MKKLLLFALIVASLQLSAQQMLVGSYNIRYKNANDSIQGEVWTKRCQVICDQVNFMAPEIFGTQEVLYVQLHDMKKALDGYDYIGIGRDGAVANMRPYFIKRINSNSLTMVTSGSARRPTSLAWDGMRSASASALGANLQ